MTRKSEDPGFGHYVICSSYKALMYKDYTLGRRGFCQDCLNHVVSADYFLSKWGIKDPPPALTYHEDHRIG